MKRIKIYLGSQCEINRNELPSHVLKALISKTTHRDPQYAKMRAMGYCTDDLSPYIATHENHGPRISFWRGALGEIIRIFKKHGQPYQIVDNRLWLDEVEMPCSIVLRPYQEPAFAVMVRRQQTVFRGAAGSGKTEVMLAAAAHFKQPTLVLVWHQRQQKTWLDRIPKYFDFEAGGIGGAFKTPMLAPITVGMIQSVRNRIEDLKGLFGVVLCDEVQRFAANTFNEVVNNLPAAVRIGASDDERRRDGREFLIYDTFGPIGWQLKKDQGQCDVKIVGVPTAFRCPGQPHWTYLIDEITENEQRNQWICNLAARDAREGHRVLIWSDRVDHCRELADRLTDMGIRAGLLIGGEENKDEADRTERGLNDGAVQVGVGTSVAEQSVNIPNLDRGIMTCGSADTKLLRFRQMRGRLARPAPKKDHAVLYYFWDKNVWQLRGKLSNIKRRYRVRIYRHVRTSKESKRMEKKRQITVESMLKGAKLLGVRIKKGSTPQAIKLAIQRELMKRKDFDCYACAACEQGICDDLPRDNKGAQRCPFCGGEFREPLADAPPEDNEKPEPKKKAEEAAPPEPEAVEPEPAEPDPEPEPEEEFEVEEPDDPEPEPEEEFEVEDEDEDEEDPEDEEDEEDGEEYEDDEEDPEDEDLEAFDVDEEPEDIEEPEEVEDEEIDLSDEEPEDVEDEEPEEEDDGDYFDDDEEDEEEDEDDEAAIEAAKVAAAEAEKEKRKAARRAKAEAEDKAREKIREELPYAEMVVNTFPRPKLMKVLAVLGAEVSNKFTKEQLRVKVLRAQKEKYAEKKKTKKKARKI